MTEIILEKRYPHSREEDITDAFMRGYEVGREQEHRWWSTFCANCKTEPSDSEKPNNCETCKHNKLEWFSEVCDGCCGAHSHYEPKTEPQKCYLRESCDHYGDKQVCGRCREYNLYSHTKNEPQTESSTNEGKVQLTDCAWGKGEE